MALVVLIDLSLFLSAHKRRNAQRRDALSQQYNIKLRGDGCEYAIWAAGPTNDSRFSRNRSVLSPVLPCVLIITVSYLFRFLNNNFLWLFRYGLIVLLFTKLALGCKIVSIPKYDANEFLRIVKDNKATFLYLVPPVVIQLANHPDAKPDQFQHVRQVMSAASNLAQVCITVLLILINIQKFKISIINYLILDRCWTIQENVNICFTLAVSVTYKSKVSNIIPTFSAQNCQFFQGYGLTGKGRFSMIDFWSYSRHTFPFRNSWQDVKSHLLSILSTLSTFPINISMNNLNKYTLSFQRHPQSLR